MHVAQHQVLALIDHRGLFMSLFAPEHEHNSIGLAVDSLQHVVGELLPSLLLVRVGHTLAHCQDAIE